jgi:glutamine synthetase
MATGSSVKNDVTAESEAKEAAKRFDYVRFTLADMHGIARSKTVARRNFNEFFADGIALFSGK